MRAGRIYHYFGPVSTAQPLCALFRGWKLVDIYLNILFKFLAYTVGYLYLAVPYVLSFAFPPLRAVVLQFLKNGSNSSNFIVSVISGSFIFYLSWFVFGDIESEFDSYFKIICMYLGYIGFGFFGLFLLADCRDKNNKNRT